MSRAIPLAIAGVSVALFGISLSFIGLSIQLAQNTTNFGPYPVFGSMIAAIGTIISVLSAVMSTEKR